MIFCLDTRELYIIEINFDTEEVRVTLFDCLYQDLPCRVLFWVNGGSITGLVEMGDGMVLKLEHGRLLYRSPIQNKEFILLSLNHFEINCI